MTAAVLLIVPGMLARHGPTAPSSTDYGDRSMSDIRQAIKPHSTPTATAGRSRNLSVERSSVRETPGDGCHRPGLAD